MKLTHNADQIARRYRSAATAVRAHLAAELHGLAHEAAALMRNAAPKFRSTLANSVRPTQVNALEWFVEPTVDYGLWKEKGRRPGKGLPRFFDPAAAGIVAWLQAHPVTTSSAGPVRAPGRAGRVGSARRQAQELTLRDRYEAMSRRVMLRGMRAQPFVKPTADAMLPVVHNRLIGAARRGAAAFNAQRGGA